MKTVNLNFPFRANYPSNQLPTEQVAPLITQFPDQQFHVKLPFSNKQEPFPCCCKSAQSPTLQAGDDVHVFCSLYDSNQVLLLLAAVNALSRLPVTKKCLTIPYLMGARSDRFIHQGDSFDLEVIANLINRCEFEKVILFDVHSDVSTALIKNAVNLSNRVLVQNYGPKEASILICPDAGAIKKVPHYLEWNKNLVDVVYCIKHRNPDTGEVSIQVLEATKCLAQHCVIIDDICDGGSTFVKIAKQIEPKTLSLIVTHGIFSGPIEPLAMHFDRIVTTNSYPKPLPIGPVIERISFSTITQLEREEKNEETN